MATVDGAGCFRRQALVEGIFDEKQLRSWRDLTARGPASTYASSTVGT